jgi:hypothetical protein
MYMELWYHVETIFVQIFIALGICSTYFAMNLNIFSYFKDYFISLDLGYSVLYIHDLSCNFNRWLRRVATGFFGLSENQDLDNHNHLVPDQPQPSHYGWVVSG